MRTSLCIVLALVASPSVVARTTTNTNNRRQHNRIRHLHHTRDIITGETGMPPQAPEGYNNGSRSLEVKDAKKLVTDQKDKKDEKDVKDMKKLADKKDDKKVLDDKKDPKLMDKKLDEKKLDEKKVLGDKKDPKNLDLLGSGEDGPGGLFSGGRVDEEDASAAQQAANANGGKKSNPAKIVAPIVVVGGVAALAGYKFFGKKSENEVETEGDKDVPVATAVVDGKTVEPVKEESA